MDTVLALLALAVALLLVRDVRRFGKYIQIRFELFRLRDQVLWLAIDHHISKEEAIRLHNTINWAVAYVREYPILFLFGLAMAYRELNLPETREELLKRIDDMPDELKAWYFEWSELTLEGIKRYTPLESLMRLSRFPGLGLESAAIPFALWMCFKVLGLRKHPLSRSELGRFSFAKAKEESAALLKVRNTAWEMRGLKPGMAH